MAVVLVGVATRDAGSATVSGSNTYWEFSKPTDRIVFGNSKVRLSQVSDGTSKTVIASEAVRSVATSGTGDTDA